MNSLLVEETLTVLVAEDDTMVNKLVTGFLTQQGYKVQSAHDGQDALEAFQREKPHIVISDIQMPKMDGWQLAEAVHRAAPQVPILSTLR